MKRHRKEQRPVRAIRLWTQEEAEKVVPYLHSIIGSLREHWLELQSQRRRADLLKDRPAARQRDQILAEQGAAENRRRAEERFEDALHELSRIDIFLVDPVQGLALVPFRQEDELAWYIFDQFDAKGLVGWRTQQDPMEKRRPFNELTPAADPLAG